jgi:acetyl esterase
MLVHPDSQAVLDLIAQSGQPPIWSFPPEVARAAYAKSRDILQPPTPTVAVQRDLVMPGPGGPMALRLYRGVGTTLDERLPVLVYFHGGGWIFGNLETHDVPCARIANAAGCAVISVDYRLAPENKFPAAVEDASAALQWVFENAATLGVDAKRIAVGGDSAGGNLAAVAAIAARDQGPALCFQLLFYPGVDFSQTYASYAEFPSGLPLSTPHLAICAGHYLRDASDRLDPRASPILATNHTGLPPTYIMTAALDPLRSEGEAYATKLRAASVAVAYRCVDGHVHGFITMGQFIAAAESEVALAAVALKAAFDR